MLSKRIFLKAAAQLSHFKFNPAPITKPAYFRPSIYRTPFHPFSENTQNTRIVSQLLWKNVLTQDLHKLDPAKALQLCSLALENPESISNDSNRDNLLVFISLNMGEITMKSGDFDKSLEIYRKVVDIMSKSEQPIDDLYILTAYDSLYTIYEVQEKFDDGIKYGELTVEICRKMPKGEVSDNIQERVLRSLARMYLVRQDFAKSKAAAIEALKLQKEIEGQSYVSSILCSCLANQKDWFGFVDAVDDFIEIVSKMQIDNKEATFGMVISSLTSAIEELSTSTYPIAIYSRLEAILKTFVNDDDLKNPLYTIAWYRVAQGYHLIRKYEEALLILQKVEKFLPDPIHSNPIFECLVELRRYPEALEFLRKFEKNINQDSVQPIEESRRKAIIDKVPIQFAQVYHFMGNYEESLKHLKRVQPNTSDALINIMKVISYHCLGQKDQAGEILGSFRTTIIDKDSQEIIDINRYLSSILRDISENEQLNECVQEVFAKILPIAEQSNEYNHLTFMSLHVLARCSYEQRDYEQSSQLLETALEYLYKLGREANHLIFNNYVDAKAENEWNTLSRNYEHNKAASYKIEIAYLYQTTGLFLYNHQEMLTEADECFKECENVLSEFDSYEAAILLAHTNLIQGALKQSRYMYYDAAECFKKAIDGFELDKNGQINLAMAYQARVEAYMQMVDKKKIIEYKPKCELVLKEAEGQIKDEKDQERVNWAKEGLNLLKQHNL